MRSISLSFSLSSSLSLACVLQHPRRLRRRHARVLSFLFGNETPFSRDLLSKPTRSARKKAELRMTTLKYQRSRVIILRRVPLILANPRLMTACARALRMESRSDFESQDWPTTVFLFFFFIFYSLSVASLLLNVLFYRQLCFLSRVSYLFRSLLTFISKRQNKTNGTVMDWSICCLINLIKPNLFCDWPIKN